MKEKIDAIEYSNEIIQKLKKGILITTKANDELNTMAISWGSFGIQWNKLIFIAYIRDSRYTKELIDQNGEFTINIPLDKIDPNILKVTGTKSGRDINKFKELNFTLEQSNEISVPGIKELPLTLECKVVYTQKQNKDSIPQEFKDAWYNDVNFFDGDYHTMYYGQVVDAYIIK